MLQNNYLRPDTVAWHQPLWEPPVPWLSSMCQSYLGLAWPEWVFDSSYLDMRWSALWSWSLSLDESLLASFRSCCTVRDILGTLWCSRLKLQRPVSAVLCGSYFLSLSCTWFSASPTGTTQQQPGRARVTQIVRLVFACAAQRLACSQHKNYVRTN